MNARVALETLAVDVAADVAARLPNPVTYDRSGWVSAIAFLRISGEVSVEAENGSQACFVS
ncbi:hypothetical protein DR64_3949 [Paraburkholderia xenovorans LB400]|uniref:Uncharacterized protein n=1 Tax=Paraburkholderia unamae TaxID=219649 RepID=A0ABX5KM34_9BURK|nr:MULTISPECIES: hypothetical protein [Paraburkholderia]AIP32540.1 hypothetical protein DR64_3949 [Paraburkholderia xenovorans LB400]PVX83210.1 hypothetical protein C7402_107116 [Paraburkholderia unamae]